MTMNIAMNATTTEPTAMVMTSSISVKPAASVEPAMRADVALRISNSSGSPTA